ncbi:MAG: hypothetical protein FWG72_03580 [Oscillospiraceae bacterium]|nr:hypothetical protein [Oscillospiraceae bacterium]
MKSRKLLSLALACLMLLALAAGCTGDSPSPSEPGTQTPGGNDTPSGNGGTDTSPAGTDPYTFTYYWNYDWADTSLIWGEDAVSAYMRDRFNTTVVMDKPGTSPEEQIGLFFAMDQFPDVMMIERDSTYQQLIEQGKLLALDDLLAGSKYAELLSEGTVNMSRAADGKVYGLLNWATSQPTGNNGWAINKKIWEEMGSPSLNTTNDLYNYLVAVRDANLTVGGMSVVPLQFSSGADIIADQMLASFGVRRISGVAEVGGELKLHYTAPGAEDAFLFLNRLWNEDLINSDAFAETTEQIREKLSVGRVAVYCGNDITSALATEVRPVLIANDPGNDYIAIPSPRASGVTDVWNSVWYSLGWNVIVITKDAENPERIFELIDFVHSNEGSLLVSYGPQGVLWDEMDANSFPILSRALNSLTSEENDELGANGRWTLLGNAPYADQSKVAINARLPADEQDWVTNAQTNITWRHSMYADAYLNISTNPQEPEGIAFSNFELQDSIFIPRIITAPNEAAAAAALREAVDTIYGQDFALVEAYKTAVFQANQALLR